MRFLTTLFIIYICWQLFKWLAKFAIRYWMAKNGGKAFYYSGGFGSRPTSPQKEGEVKVDSFGPERQRPSQNPTSQLGEYVDYEEVK